MTKTLSELIDVAYDIKVFFGLGSYELNHYEDGSFVDFQVKKVENLPTLLSLSQGHEIRFYASENYIIVRLYEKDI